MRRVLLSSLAAICLFAGHAGAQDKKDPKKWDVSNPPGTYKDIEFNTTEGTWMNLDVSPDGKEIAFDMLGDIYIMPITGGSAKVLRIGLPWEVQPRFSPDGTKIAFTSDAAGGDNIWVMDHDGSHAHAVTNEDFRLLNNAVWTPDGQYLIARKHFTSTRSAGAGEMWMYHISGGDGIGLTKRKNDQQDVNEPSVSPDGRYLYYSEDMYPGGYFQYNKDPNSEIYVIKRYDRQTGQTTNIVSGPGGACRPQVSHDGKLLAYVRRVREKSILYIQDLNTGEEWPIFDGLSKDQQEAWAIFGVYTGFNWTPDNKNIIIWGKGKLWKISIADQKATEIPFSVHVKQRIYDAVKFRQEVSPEQFTAKAIRGTVTSPDGKTIVFNAAGYLWKKALPDGKPERLTSGTDFEFEPSFSPNGKEIVYVTWNDEEKGAIYKINATGKGKPVKLTTEKGIYRTPSYSADGSRIAYQKEGGNDHMGFAFCKNPGLYWLPAQGGKANFITEEGEFPQWSADGQRIYYQTGGYLFGGLDKHFKSVKPDGSDERDIFSSKYTYRFVLSPDNKWVAFNEHFKVYLAPLPEAGKSIELTGQTTAVPVKQVARDAGISLHWSADSKMLHWTTGERYFTSDLKNDFKFVPGAPDSLPPMDTTGLSIGLVLKTDVPQGVKVLTHARIITMKDSEVIENGTIVITNNRITAIGKAGDVQIPSGAKVYDMSGKTIMPGMVDVHAHLGTFRYGLSPQKQWSYYENLAYGVTTTHDPSSNSEMVFSQSEMVKAGYMVGPRIYSTGTILYGADGDFKAVINSLADARSALRRTQAWGAFSVKSYNQPRREQRQMIIEAARELHMNVVPEGGSHFFHNMTMIADGHTGIEHNIPVAPLYNDVIQFWKASQTGYTPTLIVCYGAMNGEYYWYQHTNVYDKERLLKFMPRSILDSRARHRVMVPEEEYQNGHILVSQSCKMLADSGVKINLGAHGQLNGLGAHWELWMLQQGGMSNMQALRAATMNGAQYIGMDKEIGSLETGKLADLIVLDKNPLDDIRNSESVHYTMVNGRMYDCETMNEVDGKARGKFYWENEKYSNAFPYHESTESFMQMELGD